MRQINTVESRYFGQEKTIGMDSWIAKLKEIILHYAPLKYFG
jgi:hypothetical protein